MAYRYCTTNDINDSVYHLPHYIIDGAAYYHDNSSWRIRVDGCFVDLCGDVPAHYLKPVYLNSRMDKLKCSCCIFR